jgi:hypothetical protein
VSGRETEGTSEMAWAGEGVTETFVGDVESTLLGSGRTVSDEPAMLAVVVVVVVAEAVACEVPA